MEKILSERERINEIDEQILCLLKKRMEVCRSIGKTKREHGIPIRDYKREDELYAKVAKRASELGLNPQEVEAIYRRIIVMVAHVQKAETETPREKRDSGRS